MRSWRKYWDERFALGMALRTLGAAVQGAADWVCPYFREVLMHARLHAA